MESSVGPAFLILGTMFFFAYFIPSALAWVRKHHLFGTIFVLNFFLGWTFLGWVVALAMAAGPARSDSSRR